MKTIVLCAGHDYKFKGAYNEDYKLHEYDFVRRFVIDLYKMYLSGKIVNHDVRMLLFYIDDSFDLKRVSDSLKKKRESIDKMPEVSLFIEVHLNSFQKKYITGSEILYKDEVNRRFCELFAFNFSIYFPWFRWRGIKHRTNLYLLNTIKKSVITEPFFLSNNGDVELFAKNSNNYNMLLKMMAKTINDWATGIDIDYKKLLNSIKKNA